MLPSVPCESQSKRTGSRHVRVVGLLALGLALGIGFSQQLVPAYTVDLFYHVTVGDWILEHGGVPREGLFSATRGTAPWVDCEWGFQVLTALIDRSLGLPGLVVVSALFVTAALGLLALALLARGVPLPFTACFVGLVALALDPLSTRPQNLTYLFTAWYLLGAAQLLEARQRAPCWHLPIAAILWVNCHAGFVIGWIVLAVPLVVEIAPVVVGHPPGRTARRIAVTLGACVAASFLNPYGWQQVLYPFRYALEPALTSFNLEWEPTVLAELPRVAVLIAGCVAGFAACRGRVRGRDLWLFLMFCGMAFAARRHVGVALFVLAYCAAPYAYGALYRATLWFAGRRWLRTSAPLKEGVAAVLLLIGGQVVLGRVPTAAALGYDARVGLPITAAQFLAEHRVPGVIFNEYRWGSYLLAAFAPTARVYVDGRNDLYGSEFMAEYLHMLDARRGFQELLAARGVNVALLELNERNWRLLHLLLQDDWHCIHRSPAGGSAAIVLMRDTPQNAPWILRFAEPLDIPLPP